MTTAKDEIWLERDDQQWGGCGGAWNVVLTRDKFLVNTQQLRWMECDAAEIAFTVDDATYAKLKEPLKRTMVAWASDFDIRH
jgi:hypothetical protein